MAAIRTRKQVYEAIELSSRDVPADTIKSFLESNKAALLALFAHFKKPQAAPSDMSSDEKKFIEKAAKQLDVSEHSAFELIKLHLRQQLTRPAVHLAQGSSQPLKVEFNDDLLAQIQYLYFDERETTLLLWSSLLRASEDEHHAFFQETHEFVKDCFSEQTAVDAFVNALLEEFKSLSTKTLPSTVLYAPDEATRWSLHFLTCQKAILNVLFFMFYTPVQSTPDQALGILSQLAETRFGLNQTNSSLFDDQCIHVMRQVVQLSTLVALTVLNLESQFIPLPQASPSKRAKKEPLTNETNTKQLLRLLDMTIEVTGQFTKNMDVFSVFSLAVGCVLTQSAPIIDEMDPNSAAHTRLHDAGTKLVQKGVQSGVFEFIEMQCQDDLFQDKEVAIGYKSVLKGLVILFTKLYPVSMFSDHLSLFSSTSALMEGHYELAKQFWEQDFPLEECRELLTTCRFKFPLLFQPFMQLVTSLVGDSCTAMYALRYLKSCTTFCDELHDARYVATMERHVYEMTTPYLVPSHGINIQVLPQTRALLMATNVVSVQVQYSVWHLLICWMDAFVHGDLSKSLDVQMILDLYHKVLSCGDANVYEVFKQHMMEMNVDVHTLLTVLASVLHRACEDLNAHWPIVSKVLNVWKLLFDHEPEIVLKHLQSEGLLPLTKKTYSSGQSSVSSSRFLSETILPFEKSRCAYPMTLSFVELISYLMERSHRVDVLYPAVQFIVQDVWSQYSRWRFVQDVEQLDLSLALIRLINVALTSTVVGASGRMAAMDANWLRHQLMWEGDRGCMDPLLFIITSGYDDCLRLYSQQRLTDALKRQQTLREALRLLQFLLATKDASSNQLSPLESRLLEYVIYPNNERKQRELMLVLGLYIHYQFDRNIPLHATNVLTLLVRHATQAQSLFSLLGYFGLHAQSLVQRYLQVAVEGNDEVLQVAVVNFIASVFESQLSLAMIFYSPKENQKAEKEEKGLFNKLMEQVDDQSNLSSSVKTLLKNCDVLCEEKPALLHAVLSLLHSMWMKPVESRRFTAELKKETLFWDALIKLVLCDIAFPSVFDVMQIEEDVAVLDAALETDVRVCGYMMLCKCLAMRIVAIDVFALHQQLVISASIDKPKKLDDLLTKHHQKGIKGILDNLSKGFEKDTQIEFDVSWFLQLKERIENDYLLQQFKLSDFRVRDHVSHAVYGHRYVYDGPLLLKQIKMMRKLKKVLVGDADVTMMTEMNEDDLKELGLQVSCLNSVWSLVDARTVAMQSYVFCLRLLASVENTDQLVWEGKKKEKMLELGLKWAQLSLAETRAVYPLTVWQSEMSLALLFLTSQYLSLIDTSESASVNAADTQQVTKFFVKMVDLVVQSKFDVTEHLNTHIHMNWVSAVLKVLELMADKDKTPEVDVDVVVNKSLRTAVTAFCPWLVSALSELMQLKLSAMTNGIEAKSFDGNLHGTDLRLTVFLKVLQTCLKVMKRCRMDLSSLSTLMQKQQTTEKMVRLLVRLMSSGDVQPDVLLLHVLDTVIVIASCAELNVMLIHQGLLGHLASCDLAPVLIEGRLKPYEGALVNGWHETWCSVLSLLTELVCSTDQPLKVTQSVLSLVGQQFWQQVTHAMEMTSEPFLTMQGLKELQAMTRLFYAMASFTVKVQDEYVRVLQEIGYHPLVCCVLRYFAYLVNHPKVLSARLQSVTKEEKGLMSTEKTDKEPLTMLVKQAQERMVEVMVHCVHSLRISTGAERLLETQATSLSLFDGRSFRSLFGETFGASELLDVAGILCKQTGVAVGSVESVVLVLLYEYMHSKDAAVRDDLASFVRTNPLDKGVVLDRYLSIIGSSN